MPESSKKDYQSQAYTPGLKVSPDTVWRSRRLLPLPGEVLVKVGDLVDAEQVVARASIPGPVTPIPAARILGISARELAQRLCKPVGSAVQAGEPLARTTGLWGWFVREINSPHSGTLESISEVTGQLMLRGESQNIELKAYLRGKVVEIYPTQGVLIEARGAVIQGILGVGGEQYGKIHVATTSPHEDLTPECLTPDMRESLVIGGRRILQETVLQAQQLGIRGLLAGSMHDRDLKAVLGYELGVAVTGSESLGLTLIITEGFGSVPMSDKTFALFQSLQGRLASMNGATQIRAGVLRPEVVICHDCSNSVSSVSESLLPPSLQTGSWVRLIREPWFGRLGTVINLPPELQPLPSESRARVVEVALDSGEHIVVPRANVEVITR